MLGVTFGVRHTDVLIVSQSEKRKILIANELNWKTYCIQFQETQDTELVHN